MVKSKKYENKIVQLQQVIIAYKAGDKSSKQWAERCAQELEKRDCKVLLGPSGFKDNPYPVFLASAIVCYFYLQLYRQ